MKKLSNDQLRDAFESVAKANGGRLTPAAALAAARKKDHPLHQCVPPHFWDDKKSSEKYRLHWLRSKIRSVRLVITVHEKQLSTVFYTRDPSVQGRDQGYISVPKLRDDQELSRQALLNEFTRVAAALERAYGLAAALDLQSEIEEMRSRAEALKARITSGDDARLN
jgi:hypothetical protein